MTNKEITEKVKAGILPARIIDRKTGTIYARTAAGYRNIYGSVLSYETAENPRFEVVK